MSRLVFFEIPASCVRIVLGTVLGLLSIQVGPALGQVAWESAPRFVEADQAYMERADPARIAFANQRYEALYRADPGDWEAAWRVAMTCYFLGDRVAEEKSEQEAFFARGRDVALEASKLNPDCAPCQLLVGINMALYGQSVGVVKMIFTLRSIRSHLRRSLELDPYFAEGTAARTLATIDEVVPFLLGGSKKRARKYFEEALAIDPTEPLNYAYFARFLQKRGEFGAALELTERGLENPRPSPERVESQAGWDRLERIRAQLKLEIKKSKPPPGRRKKPGQKKRR
jgi:tetratricopeptide (TPR) repeat protein